MISVSQNTTLPVREEDISGPVKDAPKPVSHDPASKSGSGSTVNAKGMARNIVSSLGLQIISFGLTVAVTFFLPHYAGEVGLGRLTFAASFVGVIAIAIPLGTSTILMREVARDVSRTAELLLSTILLRLLLSLVAIGIAFGLSQLLGYGSETRILILVTSIMASIGLVGDAVTSALQGQERIVRSNFATLVQRFAESTLIILFVLFRYPLWSIPIASGVSALLTMVINLSALQGLSHQIGQMLRQGDRLRRIEEGVKFLVIGGMPFLGWAVAQQLYCYTDPLVLKSVGGLAAVGWYSVAFRLVGTALFIPVAITKSLVPTLMRLYKADFARFEDLARQMFAIVLLTSLPVAMTLACCPEQVVTLLHYPKGFAGCIPVISMGALSSFTLFIGMTIGTIVIASNNQKIMLQSSVVAAIISIPLCIGCSLISKRFMNNTAVGAMASDAILETILIAMYVRGLPFKLLDRTMIFWVVRCGLAALAMACCLLLSGQNILQHVNINRLWLIPPALLIYGIGCLLLRCIDKRWLELARTILGRRSPAVPVESV
jgi:O-antigen/teichoic acid export membrane protein